jgi:multiple antibiotic resistance protein
VPAIDIDFALRAFLTLFVVVDPLGLVPAYVALIAGRPHLDRAAIAGRAVIIAGIVLVAFAVMGGPLLAYLGIGLGALQVAGGVLLFRISMDMVFAQLRRETPQEAAEARSREDISVFPLAIPLIAGTAGPAGDADPARPPTLPLRGR